MERPKFLGPQGVCCAGSKIIIHPEKLVAFQHAPLSVSEEVRGLEPEHLHYEELPALLALGVRPNPSEDGPRPEQEHQEWSALV